MSTYNVAAMSNNQAAMSPYGIRNIGVQNYLPLVRELLVSRIQQRDSVPGASGFNLA